MCASVVRAWSASSDSAYVRMSVSNCWIVRPPKRTILVSKATTQKRSPCRMTKMPDAPLCHASKRELYLISIVRFLLTHPASLLRLSMCKRIFDLLHAIWHVWHAQPPNIDQHIIHRHRLLPRLSLLHTTTTKSQDSNVSFSYTTTTLLLNHINIANDEDKVSPTKQESPKHQITFLIKSKTSKKPTPQAN